MPALAWAPARLCRLLLPVAIFLLLLYFSSLHLPELPLATCLWRGRPCRWFGEMPHAKENGEGKVGIPPLQRVLPHVHTEPSPAPLAMNATASTGPPLQPSRALPGQAFQLQLLQRAFSTSLTPHGEILIGRYLSGWRELIKFMDSLGAAFGLISQETQTKIAIMQQYQRGKHGHHYRTVQSMVTFELAHRLVGFQELPARDPPSGCRTLLRLHRALKWLELFLHKLGTSRKDQDPSRMCAEAYREALAPYHGWWVRQVAALAFLALPSRQELYHILGAKGEEEGEEQKARANLLATVQSISRVYQATQDIYTAHHMLQLP